MARFQFLKIQLQDVKSLLVLMHAGMDGTGLGLVLHHKALGK